MGVASGCGEQEVGVVVRRYIDFLILLIPTPLVICGCSCKEVYRFPHTTYPYSSCICSFCSSIPTFCSFLNVFRSLNTCNISVKLRREFAL